MIRHCSKAHTQLAESHRSDGEENNILFTASPETSLRAALLAAKCSPEHHHRLLTSLPARPSPRAAGGRIPPASGCGSPRMLAAGTSCGAGSASGCNGRGHIASPLASALRDGREAPRSCCPAVLPRASAFKRDPASPLHVPAENIWSAWHLCSSKYSTPSCSRARCHRDRWI